ncbi:hypothetical protein SHJG_5325 [Streptomyces hygroscopicus subsp. jinggangensis 5008]|nr:hypothetical protein SHJG_5325 [Streptomyces hygroscopicus subsp. jinggangensis 5008]AGF64752.1 hypothetical protein SHJGH_5089 [Streptomyces hygroscopicus subsp. jinggangensis TL01]
MASCARGSPRVYVAGSRVRRLVPSAPDLPYAPSRPGTLPTRRAPARTAACAD